MDKRENEESTRGIGEAESTAPVSPLQQQLQMLYRNRWSFTGIVIVILVLGFISQLFEHPKYKSVAKILISPTGWQSRASDTSPDQFSSLIPQNSVEVEMEILANTSLQESAYETLKTEERDRAFRNRRLPSWAIQVEAKEDAGIIEITTFAYTPEAATKLANAMTEKYFDYVRQQRKTLILQAIDDLMARAHDVDGNFARARQELSRYKRQYGIIDMNTQLVKSAESLAAMQSQFDALRVQQASNSRAQETLRQQLLAMNPQVISSITLSSNPRYSAQQDRVDKLRSQRIDLLRDYQMASREARMLDASIEEEDRRLKEIAASVITSQVKSRNSVLDQLIKDFSDTLVSSDSLKAEIQKTQEIIALRRREMAALPDREDRLSELIQQTVQLKTRRDQLEQKIYELRINADSGVPTGRLLLLASNSQKPIRSNRASTMLLFLVSGMSLAVVVTIARERLPFLAQNANTTRQRGLSMSFFTSKLDRNLAPMRRQAPVPSLSRPAVVQQNTEDSEKQPDNLLATVVENTTENETPKPAPTSPSRTTNAPKRRFTIEEKRDAVIRLLQGESIEQLAREFEVKIITLASWQEMALRALDIALKGPEFDQMVGSLDNALKRIKRLEDENARLRAGQQQRSETKSPVRKEKK